MREIKFRTFDKYGIMRFWEFEKKGKDWTFSLAMYEGDKLMQYTGLKDKNGKEIYEGDIFQFGTKKDWIDGEGERGVVEWHEKLARFGLDFSSIYGGEGYTGKNQHLVDFIKGLKIIGNIYENPELLDK